MDSKYKQEEDRLNEEMSIQFKMMDTVVRDKKVELAKYYSKKMTFANVGDIIKGNSLPLIVRDISYHYSLDGRMFPIYSGDELNEDFSIAMKVKKVKVSGNKDLKVILKTIFKN